MPDFVRFNIGAAYVAHAARSTGRRPPVVVDVFEVGAPSLSAADTRIAARMRTQTGEDVQYRVIQGALFRTFLDHNGSRWSLPYLNRLAPPAIRLDIDVDVDVRGADVPRRKLLTSPFKPWFRGPFDDDVRRKSWKAAPDDYARAASRMKTLCADGLAFVNGTLFQETRTPGWAVGWEGKRAGPVMLDHPFTAGCTVVDPRYEKEAVMERTEDMDEYDWSGQLQIVDPSLLPDTIAEDALASLCLHLRRRLSEAAPGAIEPDFARAALDFTVAAETSILRGEPLEARYRDLEFIFDWNAERKKLTDRDRRTNDIALDAFIHVDLKKTFPPFVSWRVEELGADPDEDAFHP